MDGVIGRFRWRLSARVLAVGVGVILVLVGCSSSPNAASNTGGPGVTPSANGGATRGASTAPSEEARGGMSGKSRVDAAVQSKLTPEGLQEIYRSGKAVFDLRSGSLTNASMGLADGDFLPGGLTKV